MDLTSRKPALIILLYIFGMFLLPFITQTSLIGFLKITDMTQLVVLTNFISYVFLMIVVLLMFKSELISDFKRIPSVKHYCFGILKGEALVYGSAVAANLILLYVFQLSEDSQNQQMIEQVMATYPLLMASTTVLFAPVIEEVVFRYTIMSRPNLKPTSALLLSSVLFGLIHVISAGDYIYIILYLAMGLALGYVYQRSQNIWYSIGVHFLQNFISTIILIATL